MIVELWALLGSAIVMLLSIVAQAVYLDMKAGAAYGLSNRDGAPAGLGDLGGRLDRNVRNQIEGLVMFIPLVVISAAGGVSNPWTQRAAVVYVIARFAYFLVYAAGVTILRSLIWMIGLLALLAYIIGIVKQTGLPF